jgi:hypothetical protein
MIFFLLKFISPCEFPVWINEGKEGVELLTVEISLSGFKVRCVCGYGPQENDTSEMKNSFWTQLGMEVDDALEAETGFIIEMDGNLWAGPQLIPGDPNEMNSNGKMFKKFLEKYSHLTVVNSLDICEGLITRSRQTIVRNEKAVLDFFIVCDRMKRFIEKMIIDEGKQYALSHYFKKNGSKQKKSSDHNTLVMDLKIPFSKVNYQRKEFYNLRNPDCQQVFKEITDCSEKLTKCFSNDQPLTKQCNRWFKELNGILQQSFKKYRVNGKIKETEISQLSKKKMSYNRK